MAAAAAGNKRNSAVAEAERVGGELQKKFEVDSVDALRDLVGNKGAKGKRSAAVRFVRGASVDDIVLPPGVTQFGGKSVSASDDQLVFIAQATVGARRLQRRFTAPPADPDAARAAVDQAVLWVTSSEGGDAVAGGYQESLNGVVDADPVPAAPNRGRRAGAVVGARRCVRGAVVSGVELPAGVSQLGGHTASTSDERLIFIAQATVSGKRLQRRFFAPPTDADAVRAAVKNAQAWIADANA